MVATRIDEITVMEAARALGCVRQSIWRWLRAGHLPGRYDGKRWRVSLEAVSALKKKRQVVARLLGAQ